MVSSLQKKPAGGEISPAATKKETKGNGHGRLGTSRWQMLEEHSESGEVVETLEVAMAKNQSPKNL